MTAVDGMTRTATDSGLSRGLSRRHMPARLMIWKDPV